MTIQWVGIASFLYVELGIVVLLVLPFISSRIWHGFFHFHLWRVLEKKANSYFTVFLIVLVLFLLDSIREMMKYSGKHPHDYEAELQMHMKLFRSQRNYYIVGFAIFLCLVIRRLVTLLLHEAELFIKNEEAMKAALEATENLQKLSSDKKTTSMASIDRPDGKHLQKIENLHNQLNTNNQKLNDLKREIEEVTNRNKEVSLECKNLREKIDRLASL